MIKKICKKILRYSLYLITLFFIPLVVGIILSLKKFVIVRFISVDTNRIGHFAGNIEMYFCRKNAKKDNKKYYDIAFYQTKISNIALAKMWKKKLNVYPNYFIYPIFVFLNFFSKYFYFLKIHIFENSSLNNRDDNNYLDKIPPHLNFNKKETNIGIDGLKKFGLNKQDKFVCFIVRDDAYLKNVYPKTDWSYWNYRDYDIDSFLPAAEELAKLGYYVFRMGKLTKQKLKTNNKMIIDYSNSRFKSDFLDIYLGANCEFCLTTDVGFDYIPFIFRRPLASITDPIALIKFSSKKFLSIFGNYYSNDQNRKLSIKEIFDFNIAHFQGTPDLLNNNIKLVQPDQNQIKDFVIDMVNYIKNDFKLLNDDEKLQSDFIKIYKNNLSSKNFIDNFLRDVKSEIDTSKLHKEYYGKVAPSFLRNNEFLLK